MTTFLKYHYEITAQFPISSDIWERRQFDVKAENVGAARKVFSDAFPQAIIISIEGDFT